MTAKCANESLRILVPIDSDLNIGDRCDVKFISGKYAYLFPGCISCILKEIRE